jgi:hypothetical protein
MTDMERKQESESLARKAMNRMIAQMKQGHTQHSNSGAFRDSGGHYAPC